MISQLLRELLPFANGKPRRLMALLALYAIAATYSESPVAHQWAVDNYSLIRVASVGGLLVWFFAEIAAQYGISRHRAVPYHEFDQFRKDQMLANEEAADLLVRLHVLLSADDETTLADKVAALEVHNRELDKRQLRMLDAISSPYYETDATGRLTLVNDAFADLYHTTPRNMLRIGTAPYIHQQDVERVYSRFKAAISGQAGYTVEFRVSIRGTVRRCVRVNGYPMHNDTGTFLGHYGFAEVIPCEHD